MGISRRELERNRDFFKKIQRSKKNIQIRDILEDAKLTELKALQGVVRGILRFSIPLTSSQKYRLKNNRVNVRKFALTKCANKESLRQSVQEVIPSLRTLLQPLFPVREPEEEEDQEENKASCSSNSSVVPKRKEAKEKKPRETKASGEEDKKEEEETAFESSQATAKGGEEPEEFETDVAEEEEEVEEEQSGEEDSQELEKKQQHETKGEKDNVSERALSEAEGEEEEEEEEEDEENLDD